MCWYRAGDGDGTARTHALIIGVSSYTFLPGGARADEVDDDTALGLGQLTTPATSALQFARWLRDHYRNPDAPLGTIRLLLSPSDEEVARDPEMAQLTRQVPPADRDSVRAALYEWRDECLARRDHVGVLYAGGHGVQITKEGAMVLLADFADPHDGILSRSLNVEGVRSGMSRNDIAQAQFYFVDACRVQSPVLSNYQHLQEGLTLDSRLGEAVGCSAYFASAAPATYAYAALRGTSLFLQALLQCLELHAVSPSDGGEWIVTTTSLFRALTERVREVAAEHNALQEAVCGGMLGDDVVIHAPNSPPVIPTTLSVAPDAAVPEAWADLFDGETSEAIFEAERFAPDISRDVPAGVHRLQVRISPATPPYRDRQLAIAMMPPAYTKRVSVE